MFNFRSAAACGRLGRVVAATGILAGTLMFASPVQAQQSQSAETSSVTTENDSVNLEGHHHYQSAADRANDALLITEVKGALADDGVADDSPIAVDCDHGKVLLSGVMNSADDVKRAGSIAAGAPGVVAVKNQLTWHQTR